MNVAEGMRAGLTRWRQVAVAGVCVLALGGCGLGGGSAKTHVSTTIALNTVPWCGGQSLLSFQDDSTTAQTTITDWSKIETQLGFTPYLPATLPKDTCLALAGGTIHDPIYGGHLSVTYIMPSIGPVSFSEAPVHQGQQSTLQCVTSTQDKSTSICLGVQGTTTVTIASKQSTTDLEKLFKTLKPQANWTPAALPTPTTPATQAPATQVPATATATSGN